MEPTQHQQVDAIRAVRDMTEVPSRECRRALLMQGWDVASAVDQIRTEGPHARLSGFQVDALVAYINARIDFAVKREEPMFASERAEAALRVALGV